MSPGKDGWSRPTPPCWGVPFAVTTVLFCADGQQWALGKQGLESIPETHRQEVQELLTAQFEFFAAALGKTVFARGKR